MSKLDAANCPIVLLHVIRPAQNDSCNRHNRRMLNPMRNIHARVPTNLYAGAIYMHDRHHRAMHGGSPARAGGTSSKGVRAVPKRSGKKMGRIIKRDGIPCLFRTLFFWVGHYYSKHGSDAGAAMCPSLRGSVLLSGTDRHGPEISTRASSTERGFFFGRRTEVRAVALPAPRLSRRALFSFPPACRCG